MRLELSEAADADLVDLLEYGIDNFGLAAGREYHFSFDNVFAFLCGTPKAGQIDEETQTGLRRWHHRSHRIFYRAEGEVVLIVRIIHQSRDVERLKFDD